MGFSSSGGGAAQNVFSAANVYIDALNGNDNNNGLTSGTAWATNAAFSRAVGVYGLVTCSGTGKRWVTINYINQMPLDILNLQIVLDANVGLKVSGTALVTTAHSGTFSAGVNYTNSNTLASATDAAVNWTTAGYVGSRVTWTAGASVGSHAFIAKDLGSGVARISQPAIPGDPITGSSIRPTLHAPTADTYTVDVLPQLSCGMIIVNANSQSANVQPYVLFQDLHLPAINAAFPSPFGSVTQFLFNGCIVEWNDIGWTYMTASVSSFPFQFYGFNNMTAFLYACLVNADGIVAQNGSTIFVDGYTLCEGCGITAGAGGFIKLGQVAIEGATGQTFNPSGDAIASNNTSPYGCGNIQAPGSRYGSVSIVGSGNAGVGWRVGRGGCDSFAVVPKVTGTGGDFALDSATTAFAWNNSTGAYVATQVSCTWTLLGTNIAGNGCGGSAHFPRSNTSLIGPDVN